MSDIKLFGLAGGQATELQGDASDLERPLQTCWPGSRWGRQWWRAEGGR